MNQEQAPKSVLPETKLFILHCHEPECKHVIHARSLRAADAALLDHIEKIHMLAIATEAA